MADIKVMGQILKAYREKAIEIFEEKEKKIGVIREEVKEDLQEKRIQDVESRYLATLEDLRSMSIEALNKSVIDLTVSSLDAHKIDTELLHELNVVADSGIKLTESEIRDLTCKCFDHASGICIRKMQNIAESSGYTLAVPDPSIATDSVDKLRIEIKHVINTFDGDVVINDPFTGKMKENSAERLFDEGNSLVLELENKYKTNNTEGLHVLRGDKLAKAMEGKISIKPIEKENKAEDYVEKYNKEMNPVEKEETHDDGL